MEISSFSYSFPFLPSSSINVYPYTFEKLLPNIFEGCLKSIHLSLFTACFHLCPISKFLFFFMVLQVCASVYLPSSFPVLHDECCELRTQYVYRPDSCLNLGTPV